MEKVKRVALDTMVFIYHEEAHPEWGPLARDLFVRGEEHALELVASTLVVTEVLTGYRKKQNQDAERTFLGFLKLLRGALQFVPVTLEVADRAASLRAAYGISTPDAVHIATALVAGADCYLTNDRKLKRVKEISVVLMRELPTLF